jgi:hypothetical protein
MRTTTFFNVIGMSQSDPLLADPILRVSLRLCSNDQGLVKTETLRKPTTAERT